MKYFKIMLFIANMFESFSMMSDLSSFEVKVFYNREMYTCRYLFSRVRSSIPVDELLVFFQENTNVFVNLYSKEFDASLLKDKICSFSTCQVYDKKPGYNIIQEIKVSSSDKTIKNLGGVSFVEIDLVLQDKFKKKKPIQKEEKSCCCR